MQNAPEVNFPIGVAANGIGRQNSGVFSAPVLKDANQFSSALSQDIPILRTKIQQSCGKIDKVAHVDSGTYKALSSGRHLGNMAFNKDTKILEKKFSGFNITI